MKFNKIIKSRPKYVDVNGLIKQQATTCIKTFPEDNIEETI